MSYDDQQFIESANDNRQATTVTEWAGRFDAETDIIEGWVHGTVYTAYWANDPRFTKVSRQRTHYADDVTDWVSVEKTHKRIADTCTCGEWKPLLGSSLFRSWDLHVLATLRSKT